MKSINRLLKNSIFRVLILVAGIASVIIFYLTYLNKKIESKEGYITTGVLLFLFIIYFAYTMLCDLFFDEMSKETVFLPDLKQAKKWANAMHKVDFLRIYKTQYLVFLTIYYRDTLDFVSLKELLLNPKYKKIWFKNLSTRLVYNYNSFIVAISEKSDKDIDLYYQELIQMEENRINASTNKLSSERVAYVYHIDLIKAEYHLYHQDYAKMEKSLNNANVRKYNHRELGYLEYYHSLYWESVNSKERQETHLAKAVEVYPKAVFLKKD
jgi:hypothetical protein